MAIIDEIKAAEAQAQKLKDDAKAAARADAEMIEEEARKKAADKRAKAEAEAKAMISDAEREAREFTEKAKEQSDRDCEALRSAGRERLAEAVELILKGASGI
jgi:F0F1-type ATP synthase membrane subunit b/b'